MVSKLKETGKEFLYFLLYIGWVALMMLLGLTKEGGASLAEVLQKSLFYNSILPYGLVGITLLLILKFGFKQKKFMYGVNFHEPQESPLNSFSSRWKSFSNKYLTFRNVFFGSLVTFILLGLIGAIRNQFYAATTIGQQITTTGKLILGVYPGSTAETLLFLFFIFLLVIINNLLQARLKYGNETRDIINLLLIPILIGILWTMVHLLRYGDSDLNLIIVFGFGFVNTLITIATGSIFPFLIFHDVNNFFVTFNSLFSDQTIGIWTGVILVFIVFLWIITGKRKRKV